MNHRCAHRFSFTQWDGALQQQADELPPPVGAEVTLRVTHCGMCHSDLHVQAGGFDMGGGQRSSLARAGARLPLTMGHEISGEVVETGPEVQGVALAQRVALPQVPLDLRPLSQVNEALADLAAGRVVGRVVLQP